MISGLSNEHEQLLWQQTGMWSNYVRIWVRFIDDIFLIWKGDIDSLTKFIDNLHKAALSIKFTHEISTNSVNFLDMTVLKDRQGNISTDVYHKPTDTHPYLHWISAHPPYLKQSIPYSQALRLRRICSSTDTLKKQIAAYTDFFKHVATNRPRFYQKCLQTREKGIYRTYSPGQYFQPI